jgi:hypothetical protein
VIRLLVSRVDYDGEQGKASITFQPLGLKTLANELLGRKWLGDFRRSRRYATASCSVGVSALEAPPCPRPDVVACGNVECSEARPCPRPDVAACGNVEC